MAVVWRALSLPRIPVDLLDKQKRQFWETSLKELFHKIMHMSNQRPAGAGRTQDKSLYLLLLGRTWWSVSGPVWSAWWSLGELWASRWATCPASSCSVCLTWWKQSVDWVKKIHWDETRAGLTCFSWFPDHIWFLVERNGRASRRSWNKQTFSSLYSAAGSRCSSLRNTKMLLILKLKTLQDQRSHNWPPIRDKAFQRFEVVNYTTQCLCYWSDLGMFLQAVFVHHQERIKL